MLPLLTNSPYYYDEDKEKKSISLKEKFILTYIKEPQKSFRKANITNSDDLLTNEGGQVFLSWLLHKKYAKEFKEEVVDSLLKQKKK